MRVIVFGRIWRADFEDPCSKKQPDTEGVTAHWRSAGAFCGIKACCLPCGVCVCVCLSAFGTTFLNSEATCKAIKKSKAFGV